jgi:hypothetical protein
MPSPQSPSQPLQSLVFWIIWFSILAGLILIQVLAGGGIPSGADAVEVSLAFKVIPVALATASLAVRFLVIPRLPGLQAKLPAMIIGLALAEGAGILGAFIIDKQAGATRLTVFLMAIVCIVLSAPVYASARTPQDPSGP